MAKSTGYKTRLEEDMGERIALIARTIGDGEFTVHQIADALKLHYSQVRRILVEYQKVFVRTRHNYPHLYKVRR